MKDHALGLSINNKGKLKQDSGYPHFGSGKEVFINPGSFEKRSSPVFLWTCLVLSHGAGRFFEYGQKMGFCPVIFFAPLRGLEPDNISG